MSVLQGIPSTVALSCGRPARLILSSALAFSSWMKTTWIYSLQPRRNLLLLFRCGLYWDYDHYILLSSRVLHACGVHSIITMSHRTACKGHLTPISTEPHPPVSASPSESALDQGEMDNDSSGRHMSPNGCWRCPRTTAPEAEICRSHVKLSRHSQ